MINVTVRILGRLHLESFLFVCLVNMVFNKHDYQPLFWIGTCFNYYQRMQFYIFCFKLLARLQFTSHADLFFAFLGCVVSI